MDVKDSKVEHVERDNQDQVFVKDATGRAVAVDYSGSHEKVSPEEIRLVKKLDRRIMVRAHPSTVWMLKPLTSLGSLPSG